ncbi:MAG: glycosyltransferase family 4 protein [Gemmatimonadaceae bacterium]|nr:glycosyltransferase family 4 protein [Gemmatimonadaceae bacterium]
MRKIVVLHADVSEIGGAELLMAEQARYLRDRGHAVRVCALRATGTAWQRVLGDLHIEVLADPPKLERLNTPARMAPLLSVARRALAEAEVVLAHNFPTAPIAARSAPPGARTVWYCHEPYRALHPEATYPAAAARSARGGGDDGPTRQFARRARRRAVAGWLLPWTRVRRRALAAWDAEGVAALDAVMANSAFSAAMLRAALGREADAIVPPVVTMPTLDPDALRTRRSVDRRAPQLLAQTRLGVPKNLDMLIRAVALLRATHPGVHLHIAGDGAQRQPLESLARAVAPDAVTFHGYVSRERMDALAAACDVFALVPVDEPFGMVFPEAAARGLLLVGPDHGGPLEILGRGQFGAVCDAFSPAAVAQAIRDLLARDDAALAALRVQAATAMHERYAASVVLPNFERWVLGASA